MTLLRTLLFVPGTRPRSFRKAVNSGADAVILDLEDSVTEGRKEEARDAIARFASESALGCRVFVRVNGVRSPYFHDDLRLVRGLRNVSAVVIPKVEDPDSVLSTIRTLTSENDRGDSQREVYPTIETARGVLNATQIAQADPRVAGLIFGAEDLTAELRISRTVEGEELLFARSQIVLAAAAAHMDAIDAVLTNLDDAEALKRDCQRARALGFRAKLAIHPAQVPIINEAFSPTAAEIALARHIIERHQDAQNAGQGAVRFGQVMLDKPVLLRALRTIAFAEQLERPAAAGNAGKLAQKDPLVGMGNSDDESN